MTVANEMLWCATVRTKSFEERIAAAQAAGLTRMSLFPIDYHNATEGGLSPAQMRRMVDDAGIHIVVIDPFTKWLPDWQPPASMSKQDVAFTDFDGDQIFEMAHVFDAESINVIETFGHKYPMEVLVESFAAVCDRGAAENFRVHVEFMPFSGIPDLATAWEMIRTANRPNSGITFDTWHYYRGNVNNELLKTVPGTAILRVQMADAAREVQGDLMNDLLHYRLPPGEGVFPLVEVTRILRDIDGLSSVGVELFSDVFDELTAEDAVLRASASLQALYNQANA